MCPDRIKAQAGEFGFVMLGFTVQTNVIPTELSKVLLLVVALSMLLTPASFILYEFLSKKLRDTSGPVDPADEIDEQSTIIIAGVGRFGQVVNRLIGMSGYKTVVLDHDIETIRAQRKFGMTLSLNVEFIGAPSTERIIASAWRKGGGASIGFAGAEVRDSAGALLATGGATYKFSRSRKMVGG